ncbi:MAG: thiamine phosphate synthase [Muribaculaceae bacterium]|nr:thiamine phosphate synthase [Muribaculaceae bacterium]
MLQFATVTSPIHTVKEQVEVAINAGCRWIRLTGTPDDATVEEVIPVCRDNDVILILDNNTELVDRLRIHGLHLTSWTRGSVIEAREKLGPHAILGVTCADSSLAGELTGLDVDYMVIQAPADGNLVNFYILFMETLKSLKTGIHPVASGNIPVDLYPSVIATGIEGIEISGAILDAPDPSSFITLALDTLK